MMRVKGCQRQREYPGLMGRGETEGEQAVTHTVRTGCPLGGHRPERTRSAPFDPSSHPEDMPREPVTLHKLRGCPMKYRAREVQSGFVHCLSGFFSASLRSRSI